MKKSSKAGSPPRGHTTKERPITCGCAPVARSQDEDEMIKDSNLTCLSQYSMEM